MSNISSFIFIIIFYQRDKSLLTKIMISLENILW